MHVRKKEGWRDDFYRVTCAYCSFDCDIEHCIAVDFYCDNWLPRCDYQLKKYFKKGIDKYRKLCYGKVSAGQLFLKSTRFRELVGRSVGVTFSPLPQLFTKSGFEAQLESTN